MGSATPLEYAPATSRRFRWKWIRRVLFVVVTLSASGWMFYNRDEISLRVHRVYWFHRCMTHVTPPGTVLVEHDPAKAANLLATNPDYVTEGSRFLTGPRPNLVASRIGKVVTYTSIPDVVYWPMEWRNLLPIHHVMNFISSTDAICFLGQRNSPSGHARLIAITSASCNAVNVNSLLDDTHVITSPNIFGRFGSAPPFANHLSAHWVGADLSPGIADPVNPSHITIDFVVPSSKPPGHGTIDIYLRDDDTLDIHIRDPATTQGL
jgi:hypothetical protein